MIPWPLAVLSMLYGLLAFLSAVRLTDAITRRQWWPAAWALVWLVVAAGACVGLPSQREWARKCALVGALLFLLAALGAALVSVCTSPPRPQAALMATLLAGAPLIIARYLRRPIIKAQFK